MLWFYIALITAISVSTQDAWVKHHFSHLSAYSMTSYPLFYSFPLFFIGFFFVPTPDLDINFYYYFAISFPINAIGIFLYMTAIRMSPLSLTIPYLAFTPGFIMITGHIFLQELPNVYGSMGIILICIGSYVLNISPDNRSLFDPILAIGKEKGSWIMIITSFIFSFGAVFGKKIILYSSPLFFTMSFFAFHNLMLPLLFILFQRARFSALFQFPVKGLISGLIFFIHALSHSYAISLTKAAYMISIKRLSILFSVLYGGIILKESLFLFRLSGAIIMVMGALLITLKG